MLDGWHMNVFISFKMSQMFDGWHMNVSISFKMSQMFDGWHMNAPSFPQLWGFQRNQVD